MTPTPDAGAPSVPSPAAPVPPGARTPSLDVLRGVAILGILGMNIRNYGLSLRDFDNPRHPTGELAAADLWTWAGANVLLEDKMIALLSLLFGAGLVVFAERAAAAGRGAALHLRRMLWLFVIGLAHAYLLWYGDILNTYAVCGVLVWPLRRARPGVLVGVGVLVLLVAVWWREARPIAGSLAREPGAAAVERAPTPAQRIIRRAVAGEDAAQRGTPGEGGDPARPPSYLGLARWRAELNVFWHYHGVVGFNLWRCAGFMIIGMGLYRLGVYGAGFPSHGLWGMVLAGYGVGLTLTLLGFYPALAGALERGVRVEGEAARVVGWLAWPARYLGAAGVALGHMGAGLLVCRAAGARALWPLAACGRMALSNYLVQTVVCVLIFDGWAGGRWNRWTMSELYALVGVICVGQLIISPLWLARFRFGPAEWVWRALTYGRAPAMRKLG